MYLPTVQLTAEADWQLRRSVTDPARARDAALLRERSLQRPAPAPQPRRRFGWFTSRPATPAVAP